MVQNALETLRKHELYMWEILQAATLSLILTTPTLFELQEVRL